MLQIKVKDFAQLVQNPGGRRSVCVLERSKGVECWSLECQMILERWVSPGQKASSEGGSRKPRLPGALA